MEGAVRNAGGLPTATVAAQAHGAARRPVVELSLPDGTALQLGERRLLAPHLTAGARAELRWVVAAPAGTELTIRATADRGGEATARVRLGDR